MIFRPPTSNDRIVPGGRSAIVATAWRDTRAGFCKRT